MKRTFLLFVAALAVTAVVGATAGAREAATPGVTAKRSSSRGRTR